MTIGYIYTHNISPELFVYVLHYYIHHQKHQKHNNSYIFMANFWNVGISDIGTVKKN